MPCAWELRNSQTTWRCDCSYSNMDELSLRMAAGHFPQTAAKFIKDSMEKKYGPTWHVVCGEGFGFNVTYEQKHCLYMFFGGTGRLTACLVYKSCEA